MIDEGTATAAEVPSVGARLRERRSNLRLTLAEVAKGAGVSESFLSQLERDRTNASIVTLQRICAQLHMQVGDLFAERPSTTVHRAADAAFRPYGTGARKVRLTPAGYTQLESFYGEFEPYGETGPESLSHGDSEEFLLVVEGTVELQVDDKVHLLRARDGVAYRSTSPHRVREVAGERATVVWMMAPPSF